MTKVTQCQYGLSENNFGIGYHHTVFCIRRDGHEGNHVVSSFNEDLDNELMILDRKGKLITLFLPKTKGNDGK